MFIGTGKDIAHPADFRGLSTTGLGVEAMNGLCRALQCFAVGRRHHGCVATCTDPIAGT